MIITNIKTYMQRVDDRPRVLVAVETDEGITGWGETYAHGPERAVAPILDYFATHLLGEDPRRVTFLHEKLMHVARFPPGALGLAAFSAVDHALWDIAAKALNAPVYQLLGGHVRDRIRVYCTAIGAPDNGVEVLSDLHAEFGFTAVKLSPYRKHPFQHRWGEVCEATADYFRTLREGLPSHFEIAFDAHSVLMEGIDAVRLARAIEPYDPFFLEEPLRPEHMPAWTAMKAKLNIPLATGEALFNRHQFLALLTAQGADIVQPDIAVVGGLTEMRRIAEVADAHSVPVAPHNPMGPLATAHNVHFSAACPNFKILEYKVHRDVPWIADPYIPVDGHLELRPDRPGWGVEIIEEALQTDEYTHWSRPLLHKPDGATTYA
ncbi:mandelate racemase/muconate lactonizing enzyme family protein [Mameliella sp.]|uniref:mandelate racemase/muconate lactonizing enzyme family protein n=1 Tax=Mameliella sp. TaxID=1924940 RepID=UPI003BA9E322